MILSPVFYRIKRIEEYVSVQGPGSGTCEQSNEISGFTNGANLILGVIIYSGRSQIIGIVCYFVRFIMVYTMDRNWFLSWGSRIQLKPSCLMCLIHILILFWIPHNLEFLDTSAFSNLNTLRIILFSSNTQYVFSPEMRGKPCTINSYNYVNFNFYISHSVVFSWT